MRGVRSLSVLLGASVVLLACSTDMKVAGGQFTGSEKCSGCHAADVASWKDSYHSKMVRTPREGLLKEATDHWVRDARGVAGPARGNVDGRPYALDDVVMVVGTKWKQRYLVRIPATGNHQFLDKQWNAYTKAWEGDGNNIDWETHCSTCHVTANREIAPGAADRARRYVESMLLAGNLPRADLSPVMNHQK